MGVTSSSSFEQRHTISLLTIVGAFFAVPAACVVILLLVACCVLPMHRTPDEQRYRSRIRHNLSQARTEDDSTSPYAHASENRSTDGISYMHERIDRCCSEQHRLSHVRRHGNQATATLTNIARTTDDIDANGERHSNNVQPDSGSADLIAQPPPTYASPHCRAEEIDRLLEALPRVKATHANKDNCTVCLEPLEESVTTQCPSFHRVHLSCLTSWLKISKNSLCPVCRTDFLAIVHI